MTEKHCHHRNENTCHLTEDYNMTLHHHESQKSNKTFVKNESILISAMWKTVCFYDLPFGTHLVLHQNQPQQRKAYLSKCETNGMNGQLHGIHR
jgi:hypothetical protein